MTMETNEKIYGCKYYQFKRDLTNLFERVNFAGTINVSLTLRSECENQPMKALNLRAKKKICDLKSYNVIYELKLLVKS